MADTILNELNASNLFDLQGVVAVVTGGGTGIGMMISSTLVANGATVYIVGPKQDDLDRVTNAYNQASMRGKMHGIEGDVRLKTEAKRLADEIAKREKYVTVLFNNAGVGGGNFKRPSEATAAAFVAEFFDPVTQEVFDDTLRVNTIIMTSSMNGWTKDSATSGVSYPYLFSKSAIGHFTSTLAHELLPLGIRVNTIAPGLFPSEMSIKKKSDDCGVSHIPSGTKWGFEIPAGAAGGTRVDMGTLALFLVANHFVNGETVLIDGGTLLKHPSSY
ncbi:NAD(P)-binding domain superfamily protein [Pleurotus pulmonarius]|nr:hypothetical protein EYR38_002145 [Pleurotus pulmonarius]